MKLTAIRGPVSDLNFRLLLLAFERSPSLVIDCANCADPHRFFGKVPEHKLSEVYVMNAEAIYRFRDSLKMVPYWAEKLSIRNIFVTTIGTLFSYDDKEEDKEVIEGCWELMKYISGRYDVYAAVDGGEKTQGLPERYADVVLDWSK
jgi:hypothetical protein